MATFSDNFNRANGLIGSNWTQATGTNTWSVSSNQAKGTNFSIPTAVVGVATGTASFAADHEASVTITALGSQDRVGPAVRVDTAAATGYCIAVDGTSDSTRRLARFSGSGRTVIGTVNLSAAVNDVFTIRAVGSTISLFKNGSLVEAVTDSTYTSGQPGMYYQMNNSGATLVDNFSATDELSTGRRRRFTMRTPKNTVRAFKPQSRMLFGATRTLVTLPPDYFLPRNPTVTLGPPLAPTVTRGAALSPTVTITH